MFILCKSCIVILAMFQNGFFPRNCLEFFCGFFFFSFAKLSTLIRGLAPKVVQECVKHNFNICSAEAFTTKK